MSGPPSTSGELIAAEAALSALGAFPLSAASLEGESSLRAALESVVDAVLAAELLVMLPGWESSVTACMKAVLAASAGIRTMTLAEALAA